MVGSYRIVVEGLDGAVIATFERTSRVGRPAVGEEVRVDGELYRVERVCYEDDPDDRTVRRYMNALIYVRKSDARRRVLPLARRR